MAGKAVLTLALVALGGVAAGAAAVDPVSSLAGRYSRSFANGDITGATYRSEDIVEIVPVDRRHAYVRMELGFYNGHSCSLRGIAEAQRTALVYRGLPDDTFGNSAPCRLTLRRQGRQLVWDDAGGTCKGHCGARGSMSDGIAWSSKRPIRYLPRLRASREYRDALGEWRTGKPAAR